MVFMCTSSTKSSICWIPSSSFFARNKIKWQFCTFIIMLLPWLWHGVYSNTIRDMSQLLLVFSMQSFIRWCISTTWLRRWVHNIVNIFGGNVTSLGCKCRNSWPFCVITPYVSITVVVWIRVCWRLLWSILSLIYWCLWTSTTRRTLNHKSIQRRKWLAQTKINRKGLENFYMIYL